MCCTSIFTGIMTMNFPIIYVFRELLQDFFPQIKQAFASRWDFNSSFVNGNLIYFSSVLLKKYRTLSYNLFHDFFMIKIMFFFLCNQIARLLTSNIKKEYAYLFFLLKIFLIFCTSIRFSNYRFNVSINIVWHFI